MKTFTFLLALLLPVCCSGQYVLSPVGLSSEPQVIAVDNAPQSELYTRALLYLNKAYASSKDVLSTVENQSITVNGFAPAAIRRAEGARYDLHYRFTIEFKDNKARVLSPTFDISYPYQGGYSYIFLTGSSAMDGSKHGIWDKKERLKLPLAKADVEEFFNTHLRELATALQAPDNW